MIGHQRLHGAGLRDIAGMFADIFDRLVLGETLDAPDDVIDNDRRFVAVVSPAPRAVGLQPEVT
jgi:hypothetical protein